MSDRENNGENDVRCRECGLPGHLCRPIKKRMIGWVCDDCQEQWEEERIISVEQLREDSQMGSAE